MSKQKILIIGVISCVAWFLLIILQVNWVNEARSLREEQFNRQVSMALCNAIDNLSEDDNTCAILRDCAQKIELEAISYNQVKIDTNIDLSKFEQVLTESLEFFNINLAHEFEIVTKEPKLAKFASNSVQNQNHCCTLEPIVEESGLYLNVFFPEKSQHILGQMGLMLTCSILLLLLISACFIIANLALWKQKIIAENNIDFFNNLAHEFRTPLTNISLASNFIFKKNPEQKSKSYLKVIKDENSKLIKQVEKVLQIAKLEKGEQQLKSEKIDFHNLLENVVASMKIQIQNKQGIIETNFKATDYQLFGDKFHLSNVFSNLIDNANKYSKEKPEIDISTQNQNNGILISVKDNGIGMSKERQKIIFKKFQRINTGNVHNHKGFGLGLAYVKMIIEAHNGNINVKSEKNKGSQFDIFLPINSNQV